MSEPPRQEPDRPRRLARAEAVCGASRKLCPANRATQWLEAIIEPDDRVAIESDNQQQTDFLPSTLANVDAARIHDLYMVQSVLALPEHLAVFERGIANRRHHRAFAAGRRAAPILNERGARIGGGRMGERRHDTNISASGAIARRRRRVARRSQLNSYDKGSES
jgi:malonate decarboxylase alpha subunit